MRHYCVHSARHHRPQSTLNPSREPAKANSSCSTGTHVSKAQVSKSDVCGNHICDGPDRKKAVGSFGPAAAKRPSRGSPVCRSSDIRALCQPPACPRDPHGETMAAIHVPPPPTPPLAPPYTPKAQFVTPAPPLTISGNRAARLNDRMTNHLASPPSDDLILQAKARRIICFTTSTC